MEVVPRIHRIEVPLGERFVCLFLLDGEECALLIDTGLDDTPGQYLAPYLEKMGIDAAKIRYVVNTHADFDHTAGNGSVRELAPQALFMCHRLDQVMVEDIERMIEDRYGEYAADHGIVDDDETKEFIRSATRHIPIDISLSGGERLRLGPDWEVEILHTPGHSYGHLSIHDPRHRCLIIADATLYNAVLKADGGPAFPPTYRYVDTYLASMDRFAGMDFDTLLTSHYPVYIKAAIGEFFGESRVFVDRLDQALIAALEAADGPRTMRELIDVLGPQVGRWPAEASTYLCFPLLGHLERQVQYGRLVTGRRDGLLTYQLS
ncbi:MAG: MBL fold metallo-hydrolase [Candidatus Latescibacteria bacterium]|nr:MBL fold metallo-hydrolase [Candidatus Latescibacterota bacterium]